MKILIFSDSLCENLPIVNTSTHQYHIESFPGRLVEEVIRSEIYPDGSSLSACLNEDQYDVVVICFGINDLGHGLTPDSVIKNLLSLHAICRQHQISQIIGLFLHANDYEQFNEMYELQSGDDIEFCEFFLNVTPRDLAKDQFHLSQHGKHQLLADLKKMIHI